MINLVDRLSFFHLKCRLKSEYLIIDINNRGFRTISSYKQSNGKLFISFSVKILEVPNLPEQTKVPAEFRYSFEKTSELSGGGYTGLDSIFHRFMIWQKVIETVCEVKNMKVC